MRYRADELLPHLGLCPSRSAAQQLIKNGQVRLPDGSLVRKPSQMLPEELPLQVTSDYQYVSRGAGKLLAALEAFSPEIEGKTALDLGASTGGFTEVLLRHGAKKVYAVDVGTEQLHPRLRANPQVISLEQTNAKELTDELIPEKIQLLVSDLSFISVTKVLPFCTSFLTDDFRAIILIKPQFEAERGEIGSGGVVRSEEVRQRCVEKVVEFCHKSLQWNDLGICKSPVLGPKGNQEFLAYFGKQKSEEKRNQ